MAVSSVIKTLPTFVSVAVAGTPVRLFPAGTVLPKITSIILSAPASNTSSIYVGDSNVNSTTGIGMVLKKDTEKVISGTNTNGGGTGILNLEALYIVSATLGDKVSMSYIESI